MKNHSKMDEEIEICCTCLSRDRFLYPSSKFVVLLASLHLEINTNLGGICWECKSLIERLTKFRSQVLEAQQILCICGEIDSLKSYSALTYSKKYYYDTHFDPNTNIQITCTETGPILIKQEITESDDQTKEDINESPVNREGNTESTAQKSNELPRITLVQSITDQACDRNERFQPITEIIELNIPIPQPNLVEDGPKEKENTDIVGGTEMVAKVNLKQTNDVISKENDNNDEEKTLDQTAKETITLKVKLVTEDGNDVRIKEEPLSDDDDVQIDSNDLILTNGGESCSTDSVNESQKFIKEKQDDIWKRSVMLLYNRLRVHKYADRFAYPITDAVAPKYSKVIKRPMDMNTIRRNIKNGAITTTAEFQRDILLMLTNAFMYNHREHSVHLMAKDLLSEAHYQLDMLLAVHAQKTLSDDTPSPRIRRRRESKCCIDTLLSAKRPKLSTTQTKIKTEKPRRKTTPAKNFLMPVKVENIDNIEKYTSHLENTPIKRSRRKSILIVKQSSSKANKNKSLVESELEKVAAETNTKKPTKARATATPKIKGEPLKVSKVSSRRNTLKENPQEPLVAPKITSRRKTLKGNQQEPVVAPKITSRRKTLKGNQQEPVVAPKITLRRNTLKGYQPIVKVEDIFKTPKEIPKSKTSRKIKQELILAQKPEPKKRRKSVKHENIDTVFMDDIFVDIATVANDDLCVAIANANHRDMTTTQAQNVKRTLEDKILNVALESDCRYFAPRFKGKPIIVDGVIKLWCECKNTLSWLSNTVDKMPRKYGRFVVRKQSELPKKVKSALLVPGFNEVEFIIRLLKAQNRGLFVDSWVVYSTEQRGENMFLVVGIPTAVIPKLSSRGFILAYKLGSITIKFYDASGNLVNSPP